MSGLESIEAKEHLLFFTTAGCHLCDEAKAILQGTLNPAFFTIEEVDIAQNDVLIERYGVRIPVIKQAATDRELGWPFTPTDLVDFLSED